MQNFISPTKKPLPISVSASAVYAVPALEKGLDIIEALSASSTPLTLSQLSRTLGRGNNEIFRMLNVLENRRYVRRDETNGFTLSLRLFQLAYTRGRIAPLLEAARPAMLELSRKTGESCHLSILEEAEIVVIDRQESSRPIRLAVEVGGRFSAIHTVSGRMLLAGLALPVRKKVLASDPAFSRLSARAKRAILTCLASISEQGFSTASDETVQGVHDAAVAMGSPAIGMHAAVAISALHAPRAEPDSKRLLAALHACSEAIEAGLGLS